MIYLLLLTLFSAVATGAIIQFRFLGGLVGLSIASTIMNDYLTAHLKDNLASHIFADILHAPELLEKAPPEVKEHIVKVFAQGYRLQYKLLIGFVTLQFPAAAMIFTREHQIIAG